MCEHQPITKTVTREKDDTPASILDPLAYPLRAECMFCGQTIRLQFVVTLDWSVVDDA